jgi:hypothetical protein
MHRRIRTSADPRLQTDFKDIVMNIRRISLPFLVALAGSTAALAQEGTQDFANLPAATRTRAEVKAEIDQARVAGQLDNRGEAYGGFEGTQLASTRTRTQVLAELDAARRAGELQTHNQSYGSFAQGEIRSTVTRAQVRADTAAALASGVQLSRGDRSGG